MIDLLTYQGDSASLPAKLTAILSRQSGVSAEVEATVRDILRQVAERGDEALVEYTAQFDGVSLSPSGLRVPAKVLANAREAMDASLVEALEGGGIAGAALDVFELEPLPAESPLRGLDNTMLAPHNANVSPVVWQRVDENTIANLLQGLREVERGPRDGDDVR